MFNLLRPIIFLCLAFAMIIYYVWRVLPDILNGDDITLVVGTIVSIGFLLLLIDLVYNEIRALIKLLSNGENDEV